MTKYLILVPLLVPFVAFAGGHEAPPVCTVEEHETPPPVVPSTPVPPTVQPAPTPVPPNQPVPSAPVSEVSQPAPAGGSGQIWCSGPTAPGWRVDLPNGGCKPTQNTPNLLKPTQPVVIHLRDMPYTGGQGLSYGQMATIAFFVAVAGAYLISRASIR